MDTKGIKILVHASTWFAPILLPCIVFFIIQDRSVKRISLQAIFFHLIMVVLISVSWFFSFILIGIPFLIIFGLMAIICPIMGIIYAVQDRQYQYPIVKWFIQ
ncbi:DUF4870 domain-containing protein [Shimazuella sp. AN120528]|uniref:DUF4870 domain-containing protein n=1 Tax=Shimazuella soli TaxID=1892854 RepID=UPI001F0D5742|nr:DUF4870 domain-containing protein [Shimazuella soli]MCH5584014.1 DUF4870 domain-containing protein [Shimazuella soli]